MRGHKVEKIIEKAQNQLLNERIRQVNFTIEGLKERVDYSLQKLMSILPGPILERVVVFTQTAQLSQHTKSKVRQTRKFHNLQSRNINKNTETLTWRQKTDIPTQNEKQNQWVKNLSDRELTQPEKEVLAKGFELCHDTKKVTHSGLDHSHRISYKEKQIKWNGGGTTSVKSVGSFV